MAAFIKILNLLWKTGWGGSVLAGYRHVVSPLVILLLTTPFKIICYFPLCDCLTYK